MSDRLWTISEFPFHPEKLRYYETIFSVGNGYLGTRGSFEEGYPDATPATLVHGIYNHAPEMQIPELVNVPNWLDLRLTIDGTPFKLITQTTDMQRPPEGVVLGYNRTLHMKRGLLRREVLFRAASGSTVRLIFDRFASLADVHVLAQRVQIIAVDGTPEVVIAAGLDGDVDNLGMRHLHNIQTSTGNDAICIEAATNQSGYRMALAAKLISPNAVKLAASGVLPTATTTLKLAQFGAVTVDKLTTIFTSRDTDDPMGAAEASLRGAAAAGYDALLAAHEARWGDYWSTSDIVIDGDDAAQIGARFCTYHILIAAPQHDDDVSVGAKTLSGFGYKGHVFWDTELFILPPFTLTRPHIARNLLMYRYKRLAGARTKAKSLGFEGAMFPWESTDTGEETTPQWSDPQPDGTRIRIWTGDNEQHISTDITYATLQYWRWTGDDAFMCDTGAEMVLDTAVFWGSRAEKRDGRYELTQQIGPDEYHENIDNSVFTNSMTRWHLRQALDLLDWLRAEHPDTAARLTIDLDLTDARLNHWRDIIANMYIPFDEAAQHHIQFDGFFDLEYIPVLDYEPRVGGIWGMLGHQRALASQVIKQADVVMLMALLGNEVGSREVMLNNWNTYYPRCDHGSSLSPAMHAWVAARLDLPELAYDMFEHAAEIDLKDNKGNVADGIHGAASGGLWQTIVFGFCGLHLTADGPAVDPRLPAHWRRVAFNVTYRGEQHHFELTAP